MFVPHICWNSNLQGVGAQREMGFSQVSETGVLVKGDLFAPSQVSHMEGDICEDADSPTQYLPAASSPKQSE